MAGGGGEGGRTADFGGNLFLEGQGVFVEFIVAFHYGWARGVRGTLLVALDKQPQTTNPAVPASIFEKAYHGKNICDCDFGAVRAYFLCGRGGVRCTVISLTPYSPLQQRAYLYTRV